MTTKTKTDREINRHQTCTVCIVVGPAGMGLVYMFVCQGIAVTATKITDAAPMQLILMLVCFSKLN